MTERPIGPIDDDPIGGGVATAERGAPTGIRRSDAEESLYSLEKQITLLVRRTMESVWAHGYGSDDAVDRYTYPVLMLLDDEGALSLTALTGKLGVSKPTASRQVSRLSRAGLVDVSPHERDPRSVSVALTPAGLAAREQVRAARLAPLRDVIAHWPDADRESLAGLLERFTTDLDQYLR
ncbi:MarR family winged helix-turn-helix transcriptional regulator [Pseudonocardia parietis]|uniref:DNA-binding MarR family transcriptional regulator n=1 Tax=Pseudonocardia parietis TaxID=570936 RepID=A0ABS4VWE7_9PSEU|nr:MarR family transcriptional regulator [Pseudonocardia parietis]MBP2368241.1 DNA-binding MarR family transcriptional regulator [Pseudonocardia parietis]